MTQGCVTSGSELTPERQGTAAGIERSHDSLSVSA